MDYVADTSCIDYDTYCSVETSSKAILSKLELSFGETPLLTQHVAS